MENERFELKHVVTTLKWQLPHPKMLQIAREVDRTEEQKKRNGTNMIPKTSPDPLSKICISILQWTTILHLII